MQLELESEKKLKNLKVPNKQAAQQVMMFERTKVMDMVYMKYKVKLFEIMSGLKEFDLENDEEVKAVKFAGKQQREQMMQEEKKKLALEPADMEIVTKSCEEAGELDLTPDLTGTMKFESYLKIFEVVVRLQVSMLKKIEDEAKEERKTYLESKEQQKFATCCVKMMQEITKKR